MKAREENAGPSRVKTICSYCGVGCGVVARRDHAGRLQVAGDAQYPVNQGMLCSKGQALHHVVQDQSDRLLHPRMRLSRGHPLERIDWDAAIDRAAAVFRATIKRYGPDSVGFYVSGQCLTEEYYIVNKLVKGFIGCNNIDTNSRLCMSSAVAGYKQSLGDDAFPLSYSDIERCDAFLIAGANPAWCHPILFRRLEAHKTAHPDTQVVVMDPRRTQSCALADLHLQIQPGTDVAALNGIGRVLLEEDWVDKHFVAQHTEGFEAVRETVNGRTLAQWAANCRVPAEDLKAAARIIGTAERFQSWWAMGLNQSAMGVDKNLALINLSLLTGQIGKAGAGPFSLTGQPNAMGGREVGGMANLLAAHHDLGNAAHRKKVARYWESGPIQAMPGRTATEMFDALASGEMRAIWIICTNPSVSLPQSAKVDDALRKARFVVVQDISARAETCDYGDLVLPAAGWLEKEGTMTNSERRVTRVRKLVEAPGEALPDVDILCRFAKKMGWEKAFSYRNEAAIFSEHVALTQGTNIDMSGMSYERLDREGSLQWPCPDGSHPGTPRLFESKRFFTPSGKARLHGIAYRHGSELPTADYPLVLTTGRLRDQWHTMTRTGKVRKLRQQDDEPFVEVHPSDGRRFGLHEGDWTEVANDRGALCCVVRFTENIKPGVVFMPMHFSKAFHRSESRVNVLTSPKVDPQSKEPDFKYAAVTLRRAIRPVRRVVVVGAGAAAAHFVERMRALGSRDEITVIGREAEDLYNRILLPEYIAGRRRWRDMTLCPPAKLAAWRLRFVKGASVDHINCEERSVIDSQGACHPYDTLVLATGSRAALPPGAPEEGDLVRTLRTRADADAIARLAQVGKGCVVVGAGLLGIELCGALAELGVAVTLLHRSGRLMGGQLDVEASALLQEELRDRHIELILQDEIRHVKTESDRVYLRTTAGRFIETGLLVYAAGTRANDELAQVAGLHCGAGVLVDETLQSSDPHICAMGEVADFGGRRYGTTLAAQEQAAVLAARLCGDADARYAGTPPLNVLKVSGLSLAVVGDTRVPRPATGEYEEVAFLDKAERVYMRCVIRHNRLVGAILMGDTQLLPWFKSLVHSGTELDQDRQRLLRPGSDTAKAPCKGRLVCSCNQVGEGNLADARAEGCDTVDALCAKTGAGTGCGSCRPELAQFLDAAQTVSEVA